MNISSAATRTCGTQLSVRKPSSRAVRIQVTPLTKENGCQTSRHQPKMKSVEIQCNILKVPVKETLNSSAISSDPDLSHSWFSSDQIDHDDSDYQLSDYDCLIEDRAQEEERMFLVSETSFMTLLRDCPLCSSPSLGNITHTIGTLVKVEQDCGVCGHNREWNSQTLVGSIPLGNLRLSCGILFSGALPAKTLRIFQFMNLPSISKEAFMKHQKMYLQPVILDLWKDRQRMYLEEVQRSGHSITIGGYGRFDTPGHSAKFGSYSVMDLDKGKIIDVQLVQVSRL